MTLHNIYCSYRVYMKNGYLVIEDNKDTHIVFYERDIKKLKQLIRNVK